MIGFPSRRKIRRGEPVLMDIGARVEGYCADLSRTLVCGRPNQKQKEVVAAVHQMYAELVRRSKPGMGANDLDKTSAKVAKECGFGSNVQHLAGHGVGIDVHEKPLFDVENTPLMPSTVDALEPGLYVPSVGGFIVENTAIITDSGCEVWNKIPLGP
jgi:Xaa-Pro aminopeptidase